MDKLRDFWRFIRRTHFWLICTTVLALSTVAWFFAVGQISKERDTNRSKYEGLFGAVSGQTNKDRIPNDTVATEMAALIEERTAEISDAWAKKFAQQNSEEFNLLTFPKELGDEFVNAVSSLRPIEKELPFPLDANDDRSQLRISLREAYREYIYEELPRMAASIGAQWYTNGQPGAAAGGYSRGGEGGGYGAMGGGAGRGESLAAQSVVKWDPANQAELVATHFTWGAGASSGGMMRGGGEGYGGGFGGAAGGITSEADEPDVLDILYAQEDLWVLRALMKIIKDTNGDVTTRYAAAIKTIESIRIGKDAVESTGRILLTQDAPSAAGEGEAAEESETTMSEGGGYGGEGGYGSEGGYGGEGGYGEGGGMSGGGMYHDPNAMAAGGEGGEEGGGMIDGYSSRGGYGGEGGGYGMSGPASADPAEGRYVDKNYQPLSATKLRSVMTSTETMEPEDAYLAVAKRIPVRMRLTIDQRKLTNLLVACANAELTVEVRQLRWNPEDIGQVGGGGMMGGGYGRGGGYGGGGFGEGGGRGGLTGTGVDDGGVSNPFPFDVTVEIYGIVYIYNPVDNRALGEEVEASELSMMPSRIPAPRNSPESIFGISHPRFLTLTRHTGECLATLRTAAPVALRDERTSWRDEMYLRETITALRLDVRRCLS